MIEQYSTSKVYLYANEKISLLVTLQALKQIIQNKLYITIKAIKMELLRLFFGLSIGLIWTYSGMILLFMKNKSHICLPSYRMAKKYMVTFLIFSGVSTVITSILEKLLEGKLECLSFCILVSNSIGIILLLLFFINLFGCRKLINYKVIFIFTSVLILIILYYTLKYSFIELEAKSMIEQLKSIQIHSLLTIKFLIVFLVVLGTTVVVYRYFHYRKTYLYDNLGNNPYNFRFLKIKRIDQIFLFMILLGIFSSLNYILMGYRYDYIYKIIITGGLVYYIVSIINCQQLHYENSLVLESAAQQVDDSLSEEINEIQKTYVDGQQKDVTIEALELFDESYHYAKRAVEKWVNNPEKPYLKAGITLKDAALGIGLSRRRLSDFVKKEYGCNFNMWINTLRIKEVERILSEEDNRLSLSYIADCTGFSDLPGMSNTFKKIVGISPSQYRNKLVEKAFNDELAIE